MLSIWIYSAVWYWYIESYGSQATWWTRPWYPKKSRPSFIDALAALRRCLWRGKIICAFGKIDGDGNIVGKVEAKITETLVEALANAA